MVDSQREIDFTQYLAQHFAGPVEGFGGVRVAGFIKVVVLISQQSLPENTTL